jgi:transposase-like protein
MDELKEVRIKGFPKPLKVNEDGTKLEYDGKSIKINFIKPKRHRTGYYVAHLKDKLLYMHRIVAEAYLVNKKPVAYKWVLHKNGNSLDNHYSNLMWGNSQVYTENNKRLVKEGIIKPIVTEEYRGSSSISYEDAVKIAKRLDKGEFAKDICKEFNVSEMSIARIRKRYCKKKVASPRYEKDIKETVIKLAEKHTAPHIAKITGIKYHTVYRWLKNSKK